MAGVAEQLGLDGSDSELLWEAADRWQGWATEDARLMVVSELKALRPWLRTAGAGQADSVLLALAGLASPRGGDSVAAAGALAWTLLPGACSLARRLRGLSPRIDELVAAQLWIEVRTFPWERLHKVAANILANTRAAVMFDCGVGTQVQRFDRTWGRTRPVDPTSAGWATIAAPAPASTAEEELATLLDWACRTGVISQEDRALLVALIASADASAAPSARRGRAGLMATDVSAATAGAVGLSPVTVRRRARRSMAALTAACAETEWFAA